MENDGYIQAGLESITDDEIIDVEFDYSTDCSIKIYLEEKDSDGTF